MIVIYGLRALSAMINPEVKEIMELIKLDMSILASASIDCMLTNLVTTPHLDLNIDNLSNPNLFEYSGKLDEYLLELKQRRPAIPYSTEQLKTIISEVCIMFYIDLYYHLKNMAISLGWYMVTVDYSIRQCDFNLLTVEYHGACR